MKTQIKKGKDLPNDFIKFWNKSMKRTFGSKPIKNFKNNLFFSVKNENKIVALGLLIPVKIDYLGKEYDILGFGDITSLERKKGYGKILMESIKKFLKKNKKTGIGFCHNSKIPFYKKCGFKTKKRTTKRFFYLGRDKKEKTYARFYSRCNPAVIYFEGKDNFVKEIMKTDQKIKIPIQFW